MHASAVSKRKELEKREREKEEKSEEDKNWTKREEETSPCWPGRVTLNTQDSNKCCRLVIKCKNLRSGTSSK